MQSRLLIVLYPACATCEADLQRLIELQMQEELLVKTQFCVLTLDSWQALPTNMLCWLTRETEQRYIHFGPTINVDGNHYPPAQANLVLRPDPELWTACCRWFDFLWACAIPLTPDTTAVPALVPAAGSPEAAALWEVYVARCRQTGIAANGTVMVDPETGELYVLDKQGHRIDTASESILPQTDALAAEIARIYTRGSLATIDKTTRLKPFESPIDPQWFGLSSNRQVGAVNRRVSYRISPFDADTLKQLDKLRKGSGEALPKFTFPLGDGVRWMPTAARPLFEKEMQRADAEGKKQFEKICGTEPAKYVESRLKQIREDADRMMQELRPNQTLSDDAFAGIVKSLKARLQAAADGPFSPKVSYAPVQFQLQPDTDQTSTWGQALTLLHAIALFPRQWMTDPFLLRGLKVNPQELLKAMNVADDDFIAKSEHSDRTDRAYYELDLLKDLMTIDVKPHLKCIAILALLHGDPYAAEQIVQEHPVTE